MPITDNIMALGSWTLDLDDSITREATYSRLDLSYAGFALFVVTPEWIDPNALSPTDLRAYAEYVGVYRERLSRNRIGGCSTAVLLGDEQGKGELIGASPFTRTSGTLEQWIGDFLPSNGIGGGVNVSSPATTYSGTIPPNGEYWSARRAIHFVCDAVGAEWRMENSNGSIGVAFGAVANLYGTTSRALITPRPSGRGAQQVKRLIPATQIEVAQSAIDWTSDIIYRTRQGAGGLDTESAGSNPFYGYTGDALKMQAYLETSSVDPANIDTLAASELARTSSIRQQITLRSSDYTIPSVVDTGYYLDVYAPEFGLLDTGATQVPFDGGIAFPTQIRCVGRKWSIGPGKGVYLQRNVGGTVTTIDLSKFYVPEKADTEIYVGSLQRVPTGSLYGGRPGAGTAQSVATPIGVTIPAGGWVSFTPAFAQSGAITLNAPQGASYQLSDRTVHGEFNYSAMTVTAGGSAGNDIILTLPVTAKYVAYKAIGHWRFYDASSGNTYGGVIALGADGDHAIFMVVGGSNLGVSPSLALTTSDWFQASFTYETAS